MAILDTSVLGRGDESISEIISPELEEFRQKLRDALIAGRSSSYTYRNPQEAADRTSIKITVGGGGFGGDAGGMPPDVGGTSGGGGTNTGSGPGGGADQGRDVGTSVLPPGGGGNPGGGVGTGSPQPNMFDPRGDNNLPDGFRNEQELSDYFNKPVMSLDEVDRNEKLPSILRWLGMGMGMMAGIPGGGTIGKWIGGLLQNNAYDNKVAHSPVDNTNNPYRTGNSVQSIFESARNYFGSLPNSPTDPRAGSSGFGILGNMQPVDHTYGSGNMDPVAGTRDGMPGRVASGGGGGGGPITSTGQIGFGGRATRLAPRLNQQAASNEWWRKQGVKSSTSDS